MLPVGWRAVHSIRSGRFAVDVWTLPPPAFQSAIELECILYGKLRCQVALRPSLRLAPLPRTPLPQCGVSELP